MTTLLASFPSPAQGVWHLGPLPIRAYALCIIVGIVVALVIGDRRWEARGGETGVVYDLALWAVPFGLIGGRLYHVLTDWPKYFGSDGAGFLKALQIWEGGLGIWGAVALGGVGAWIGCRRRGIPLPAFGDAIAPGIVLAQAIGRLGNYFNQELYGRETTLPWGLQIFERRDAAGIVDPLNGVSTGQLALPYPVHPTFLYELVWNVGVFVLLIYLDRRFKLGHGRLFATYVAAYCVGRFWVELLRDDPATLVTGIRINSFTSTFVFIGAVVYIMLAAKGREDPATLGGTPRKPQAVPKPKPAPKAVKKAVTKPKPVTPPKPAKTFSPEVEESPLVQWTKEIAASAVPAGVVAGVAVADEGEPAEEYEAEAANEDDDRPEDTAVVDVAESEEPTAEVAAVSVTERETGDTDRDEDADTEAARGEGDAGEGAPEADQDTAVVQVAESEKPQASGTEDTDQEDGEAADGADEDALVVDVSETVEPEAEVDDDAEGDDQGEDETADPAEEAECPTDEPASPVVQDPLPGPLKLDPTPSPDPPRQSRVRDRVQDTVLRAIRKRLQ